LNLGPQHHRVHNGPSGQRAWHGPDRVEDQELPQGWGQPGKKSGLVVAEQNSNDRFWGQGARYFNSGQDITSCLFVVKAPRKNCESQAGALMFSRFS
jgi:hypothetical protein